MDLTSAIRLRSAGRQIQAGVKEPHRLAPVHEGAHGRFMKAGYQHTGNKLRGGIPTSEYFKTKSGNSRSVSVQADGSYYKTSRTAKGIRKSRGKIDGKGMKAHNVSPEMTHEHKMRPVAAADKDAPKVDHLAEYQNLMKKSAAHGRAAQALADSHQDEDRELYEHHSGKAWRLGNKAMDHFKRLTKEQRAMLKDQHWQNSRPAQQGVGKKKVAAGGPGSGRRPSSTSGNQKALDIMHKGMVSSGYTYNKSTPSETVKGATFHDYKSKDGATSAGFREHPDGKLEFMWK